MARSTLSARARKNRARVAELIAIGVALAVPLSGFTPATRPEPAAATIAQAAMSGKGEPKAPSQRLGSGKLPELPPVKNRPRPPSLRSQFPIEKPKPVHAATKQPAPKEVAAPVAKKPKDSFNAKTSRELPEKRARYTQTYQNQDQTQTTILSQSPVNYRKPDGTWAKINPNLQSTDDGGWEQISNDIYTRIAPQADADPLARIEFGQDLEIGWSLSRAAGVPGQMTGNKVLYPGVVPNADLELESQPTGIKETVVLKTPAAARAYIFPLSLKNLTASLSGKEVILTDQYGVKRAKIPAGTMEDSNTTDGRATSDAVTYELTEVNGRQALKVIADSTWLDDPTRVYPVRLDPTFYLIEVLNPNYAVTTGRNGSAGGGSELLFGRRGADALSYGDASRNFS